MLTEDQVHMLIREHEDFNRTLELYDKPSARRDAEIAIYRICIRTLKHVLGEAPGILELEMELTGDELSIMLHELEQRDPTLASDLREDACLPPKNRHRPN